MDQTPGRLTLGEGHRRLLADWAADCAAHVLPLFEAQAPGDSRPRAAIDGLRAFGRGELRVGKARALSVAAHAAARDVGAESDEAAGGANPARVRAAVAAARAAGQAVATAHMAAHARGAPAYAAVAAAFASPADPGAADAELAWAIERASPAVRVVLRMLPEPPARGGRLGALIHRLHEAVAIDNR